MKTSLLVLSLLMASTNAIDIQAAPADHPVEAKAAAPHAAVKAHVAAAAPKASDHVAKPEHHIVAKGHNSLKKASAVKAPSPKVAKSDDDKAAASDDDAKLDDHEHEKCNTPSCRAARDAKKEDDDEKD